MKFLILFVSISIGIFGDNSSQDKPSVSEGDLQFYVDYTSFMGKEGKTYVEFYLMIYADQLKIYEERGNARSEIKISSLISGNNKEISSKEWTTDAVFDTITDLKTLVIYDKWEELIDPGDYNLYVKILDPKTNLSGTVKNKISIPSFDAKGISLSCIKFITNISEPDSGIKVTPNPSRRYGLLNPTLYFYYELYTNQSYAGKNLSVNYKIADDSGNVVKSITGGNIIPHSESIGYTQAVDVSKIPSGLYSFRIELTDSTANKTYSAWRSFEIIQPDYFLKSAFLTSGDSKILERILEYLADPEEVRFYNRLNTAGKAEYIINFFRQKDPSPGTSQNEFLNKIISRYQYANKYFGWGSVSGYTTERGRVFIQQGKPDEVEYHNLEQNTRPYEVWYYRGSRELYYVFADVNSSGKYVLLHSSKEGEIKNPQWMELIKNY